MALKFDTKKDIPDLSGKVILVTGGTAGLGAQTTLDLVAHNPAKIYITGRNTKRAEDVISKARVISSTVEVKFLALDQSDLRNVAKAAESFLTVEPRLDILICNAGIMATPPALTKDGYEMQFGVNHLGHAMLIKHLLPLLQKTSDPRIILLTSTGFQFARNGIPFATIKTTQEAFFLGSWSRYGNSKLANLWYARELARHYPSITSLAIHPGVAGTDLIETLGFANRLFVKAINAGKMISEQEAVYNTLWAVGVPRDEVKNGSMYEPVGQPTNLVDGSKVWKSDEKSGELWDWTQKELAKVEA